MAGLADRDRLAALRRSGLMEGGAEEAFDRFTRLACEFLGAPALITLIDDRRQFVKSAVGVEAAEAPLSHSFCRYVIADEAPLVIADARLDARLAGHPAVEELGVVAYCGVPLADGDGHVLGSLCAISERPREWGERDVRVLRELAAGVMTEVELRAATLERERLAAVLTRTLEDAPIGMALVAPDGRWLRVNRALCELVGYDEAELLRCTFQDITHPDDLDADLASMGQVLAGEIRSYQMEKRYVRKDGQIVPIKLSVSLVRAEDAAPLHFIAQIEDVGEAKAIEQALRESEARLQEAQATAHVGSWEWDVTAGRLGFSDELCRIFGRAPGFAPTLEELLALIHPEDRERVAVLLGRVSTSGERTESEHRIIRADGEVRYVHARRFARFGIDGQVTHAAGTVQDITDRKRAEIELERLATHDALTGLPNHRCFHEQLRDEVATAIRQRRPFSVAIIDIDHFKRINDRHGHPAGDRVLRDVAARLAGLTREGDLIARVGGEEFAWILPGIEGLEAYAAVERVRLALHAVPLVDGHLTVSAGVCDLGHAASVTELYERADQALYCAKQSGRNRCVSYGPGMASALAEAPAP